ncbi:MAG: hypothetical protein RBJ76_04885 [Stenomitos frigidus ULC029]
MRTQISAHRVNGGWFFLEALQAPRTRFLVTNAALLLAIKFGLDGYLFSALCVTIAWGHIYPHQILKLSQSIERFSAKRRWSPVGAMFLLLAAAVGTIALFGHVEPASAQFFQNTQTWMVNNLAKGAGGSGGTGVADMIALTFNVLRALFVIYLGISLVKVVQNARDGEDWQTLAKTPLIILVTVTLGDVLGALITGNGSSGAGTAGTAR